MPLPLIPIAIVVGSVAVIGVLNANIKKDVKRYKVRRKAYLYRHKSYRDFFQEVNRNVSDLNQQRMAALETLREAAKFLVRANVKDRNFDESFEMSFHDFEELKKKIEVSMIDLAASLGGGAMGGAVVGAAASGAAYKIVGSFASASTGIAIRSLSGIAARNATLAWLGGGSLASGGGGVAAGAALLARIVWVPLAAVPIVVTWAKAQKVHNQVEEEIAKIKQSEAEIGKHKAELNAVLARAREISESIHEVEQALKEILRTASVDVIEDVYRVASLANALAELLDLKTFPFTAEENDLGGAGIGAPQ